LMSMWNKTGTGTGGGPSWQDMVMYGGQNWGSPQIPGYTQPKTSTVNYFNPQGGTYTGGNESYWYTPEDQSWYQGQTGGQVNPIKMPPWMMGGGS